MAKKTKMSGSAQRALRWQQIIMGIIGIIVVLSMIISLVAKY